jgi:hypothetical protein
MPEARSLLRLTRIGAGAPAQVLVVLYVLLAIGNSLTLWSVPRRLLVLVGVLLLIYEAVGFRTMKHEQIFLYVVGAWISAALTLNGVVFGEWVQESVYLPGNIGVALALCRRHVSWRTTAVLFYGIALYFAYRLVTAGSPGAIHLILVTGSANGISAFVILLCCLHYAVTWADGRRIELLPALTCFLVSALTLGRSGMGASAMLVAGIAVYDLLLERRNRLLVVKLLVYGAVVVAAIVLIVPRLELISFVFDRFAEYGVGSEARDRIWAAYGETLTSPSLLIGHGREQVFGGYTNVHSSYILWHKSMGLMAIPLYLLAAAALLRALVRDWILFVLLGALLFRSGFDEIILPFRLFDFVFYYLVCTLLITLKPRRAPSPLPQPAEA